MEAQRRFVVLGLGSFGTALARRLSENGCRVTGVDHSEERVRAIQEQLYEAVVGDVTDRQTLEELLVSNASAVFISLGENIERSILAALHAKELGAVQIYAKAVSEDHGRILRKLGVDRAVFPEAEIAVQLADSVTWPNILETIKIDPEYGIIEIAVPPSLVGQTLQRADLRRRHGVTVLCIKDALRGTLEVSPNGEFQLSDDQMLLLLGKQDSLRRFREVK
jgi:trk system potassium uptake protein TrkA